jgi:hypothetical protein
MSFWMKSLCSFLMFIFLITSFLNVHAQTTSVKLLDGYYITTGRGVKVYDKIQDKAFYLENKTYIPIKHVRSTEFTKRIHRAKVIYELNLSLDSFGTSRLARLKPEFDNPINLALVVNNKVLVVARLFSTITSGNMALASNKLKESDYKNMKVEIDRAAGRN